MPPKRAARSMRFSYPVVIKADGLAAGKGVVVAEDRATAEAALTSLKPPFVIEEFLSGEEVSYIVLSDGRNVVPLEPTQDHKAVFDGDAGPNTGGMGAYCDSRILTAAESSAILDRIIRPTIEATGFTGFLYAGLMMTERRTQSAGVQRPPGRPGNSAHHAPHADGSCSAAARGRTRRAARHAHGMDARSVGLRGAGIRRLSGRIHCRQAASTESKRPRPRAPLFFTRAHDRAHKTDPPG